MKNIKTIALVMAMAMVVLAGCGGGGGADDSSWTQNKGTYFTVDMPGTAEMKEEGAEELAAMGDMSMKMYLFETSDKKEAYAVVEMDWTALIDQIKEAAAADDTIKEQFKSQMVSTFGGDANAASTKVGDQNAIKLSEEAMSQFGLDSELEGTDIKAEIYMVATDQAIIVVMYGGEGSSYNDANAKKFFDSFKGVNMTSDVIGL